jgi:hypothetical protein
MFMSDEKNTSGPEESGLKEKLWDVHPIVMATAKIPTRPILKSYALIKKRARRGRRSIAFYAQPLRGKTTSITVLKALIQRDFPGCGIYEYRVGSKDGIDKPKDGRQVRAVISKGGFYESLIHALDEDLKLENSVERKKEQFCRALYARSVTTRRLFIFLDEAQALVAAELGWLKDVVNDLVGSEICVTVVLFGQEELKQQFESLKSNLRSDLLERFIQDIYEFEGIADEEELRLFLHACDAGSEFPSGSGLSYSQFLWPTAYAAGFRLASCAHDFWEALVDRMLVTAQCKGIGMSVVAEALAELADMTKEKDSAQFSVDKKLLERAIGRSR